MGRKKEQCHDCEAPWTTEMKVKGSMRKYCMNHAVNLITSGSMSCSSVPKSSPLVGPRTVDSKLDRMALTEKEIADTQRVRPKTRYVSTPQERSLQNNDLLIQKKRAVVYGEGKQMVDRLPQLAKQKLGTGNFNVVSSNGFRHVIEVA